MFFKKKGNNRSNGHIDTLIGSGTVIHGDVRFSDGLHIDGVIKGNVISGGEHSMLTMSEKGRIEGEVWVHDLVLNGEVVGDVHASHHVELAPNARVKGNVYYSLIEMAMGAEVNGSLVHEAESTAPKPEAGESGGAPETPELAASQS